MFGFMKKVHWQVIYGTLAGIAIGYFFPTFAVGLKIWADLFIQLIKIVIPPIIFCTIVTGIASITNIKKLGKVGGIALLYFEIATTLALILGMVIFNLIPIGEGMNVNIATLDSSTISNLTNAKPSTLLDTFLHIFPKSFIGAFANGEPVQILFLSVLFGLGLQISGGAQTQLYHIIDKSSEVFFKIMGYFIRLAGVATLCSMAYTVGKFGLGSLIPLMKFVLLFAATCLLFVVGLFGSCLMYTKVSLLKLVKVLKEEIMVAFGAGSSEAVMPQVMKKLETELKVPRDIVGLVMPAGTSFNLTGSTMYFTAAAVFLAQATNTPFPLEAQITLCLVLLVASKGATAIYGSSIVILGSTLASTGFIPVETIAIVFGVDKFLNISRTITNLVGNATATLVIAQYAENQEERIKF